MTRSDGRYSTTTRGSGENYGLTDSITTRSVGLFRKTSTAGRSDIKVATEAGDGFDEESQISPTSIVKRAATASSNISPRDNRANDFGNYRRDLSVLETSGSRVPSISHTLPPAGTPNQAAPWMSAATSPLQSSNGFATSFFNDSSDNVSQFSQVSSAFRPSTGRSLFPFDPPEVNYLNDERRPSVASIATASSTGSRSSSVMRHGAQGYKKLQGFFGEDFPGKNGSDSNLPAGKDQRSNSYSRRHGSNATEIGPRDSSPRPVRPLTPIPSSDVVPFLYQDSEDISLYGEAPVRGELSGPDRGRYKNDDHDSTPSKASTSSRSGQSHKIHLPGHAHRHNKSTDDPKPTRPGMSREGSTVTIPKLPVRTRSSGSVNPNGSIRTNPNGSIRTKSPTPSKMVTQPETTSASAVSGHGSKRSVLNIFRRHRDKEDQQSPPMKHPTGSTKSLSLAGSRDTRSADSRDENGWNHGVSEPNFIPSPEDGQIYGRPAGSRRQATFNKIPHFGKKRNGLRTTDDYDQAMDPTDQRAAARGPGAFDLDLNLNNMEGILATPTALTPLDNSIFAGNVEDEAKIDADIDEGIPGWNAPDSWAVKKVNDDNLSRLPEIDEDGIPPKADENAIAYFLRIFRGDGTFATMSLPLNATVSEVMHSFARKTYVTDNLHNYQIILKKHDLQRILGQGERPLVIQKKLLEQAGYEEQDQLEDIGREDNSYLCRFLFVPTRESGYAAVSQDPGLSRLQKFTHVDLSGRNLITIPIALYSKAAEIISLNLSRNLSLDLPNDFVQSCLNLRDIKYINNEAWRLPPSLVSASRLTILDVSNNRLEQLEHAELSKLQGLVSLKLANNRLTHLPSYFHVFQSLRTLNVSSNFLEKFPDFLCDIEALVDLDLSFNSIATLPENIGQLRSLERFVITNNRLGSRLPDTFCDLVNLKEIDIRYNALTSIDVLCSLPRVEQISADHNSVSVFEGTFEKIRILRLNSNPVTKFELLKPILTLTQLNLANAKLATIPDAVFGRMPNLAKLVLDNNHFVSLPSHIGKLRILEEFSIARNSLNSLPAEIGCLTELRKLDVRQNNLKKLPPEIWWANKLETLNISSNVLDNFPKPASRPPQVPGESSTSGGQDKFGPAPGPSTPDTSNTTSYEELGPIEGFGQRRPSQASASLLQHNGSPNPGLQERKASVVSLYGKAGRQTGGGSRNPSSSTVGTTATATVNRKDSSLSTKVTNTFAGSMKNLYMADNQLDDDVFDEITMLGELRVLNLSYNVLNDVPQRSIRSWPQLTELYLSGNELTSLPSDDFEEFSLLQVLHINDNKFQTLPAELGKAHRLTTLDCGSNSLKYNVSNWPYDWNWNWNTALKYLNLSGNKRLEIKPSGNYGQGAAAREGQDLTNFNTLTNLRILGLMDVTLTIPTIPDETEDRRVRTSGSLAGSLAYGMADSLGKNEHLSTIDMVVPRFNSSDSETLLGMFDGQALSSGGSKVAKYLHENFGGVFADEMKRINANNRETPEDALRRAFLALNKDLASAATAQMEDRPLMSHRGSAAPVILTQADLQSGGVATVIFLQQMELYVANVGDAQSMLIQTDGGHRMLTRKHDPAESAERQRIRDAGGWVSRQGKLNDILEVSRAFGYVQLMPAVQASPHVTRLTLKESDEIIIIASRELWEYLPPGLVVDMVRSERLDLMRAAQKLRDLALAYGATGKIMVMMIGISDIKKRERLRLNRGTSMSMGPSGIPNEPFTRRRKPKGTDVEDSGLRRLDAEIQAPVGDISIVFTDIKSSTSLWENHPAAMRSAIKQHNEVMRRQLRIIGGYEVKTEGDAFIVSFQTATSAILWCFSVQLQLLEVEWPSEVLSNNVGKEVLDNDGNLIYRGLSVRMGIHFGNPVCEIDPVTRRMDYFGPMVNKTARISAVADGGQISVSTDFIAEIQRCLETYSETDRNGSTDSDDTYDGDMLSSNIRRELRSLSSQGFEVKDMGERKLKGLENPEFIYLMYPHALSGRIDAQPLLGKDLEVKDKPSTAGAMTLAEDTALGLATDNVWALWAVSLRLEMVCDKLMSGSDLLPPPSLMLMDHLKNSGGQVSDEVLLSITRHVTVRIENCIACLLSRRHVADAAGVLRTQDLNQYAMSIDELMNGMQGMADELAAYRACYGAITPEKVSRIREIED